MSKEQKLVPELRFPEFKDDGEWEGNELGLLGKSVGGGTPDKSNNDYWTGTIPWISSSDLSEDDVYNIKTTRFINKDAVNNSATKTVPAGSILFVSRVGVGKLAVSQCDLCTSQDFINFIPFKLQNYFLAYYFCAKKSLLQALNQGTSIKGFSKIDLEKLVVTYPKKEEEQQKIAACLSSLDELITAQQEKLEALKEHKKGLLQNLFPQEGETAPKYRFHNFQGDGEWTEKKLGDCLSRDPEYGINAPAVPYSTDLPTYLRITDISEDGNFIKKGKVSVSKAVSENNYLRDEDIVLTRTGASVGKSYKYRSDDGKLVFAGFLIRITPDAKKIDSELLFQYLSSKRYWKWVKFISARSGQPGINSTEYASMPINLPPTIEEQKKVSQCLSTMDACIAVQTEKIEQLQLHKKGLMKLLFPNIYQHNDRSSSI